MIYLSPCALFQILGQFSLSNTRPSDVKYEPCTVPEDVYGCSVQLSQTPISSFLFKVIFRPCRPCMTRRISIPNFGLLPDESLHKRLALLVLQNHNLDPSFPKILLSADKGLVLANDDALHLVQNACALAHVTRRKCRIHCSALVCCRRQSARILQRRHFGLG